MSDDPRQERQAFGIGLGMVVGACAGGVLAAFFAPTGEEALLAPALGISFGSGLGVLFGMLGPEGGSGVEFYRKVLKP